MRITKKILTTKGILMMTVAAALPLLVYANTVGIFSNGDTASNALGQYDDNLADPGPIYIKGGAQGGINRLGFSAFFNINNMAVDTVHHRLFMPDTTQGRIFVYNLNTDNSLIDLVPDNVLGGPNFYTSDGSTTLPIAVAYDPVHDRLFVSQVVASGILVFDTSVITDGMSAQYIIGRPTLTIDSYGASAATASGTSIAPYGLAMDTTHNRLFASDFYFNRVMAYDLDNLATGMNASYVLGQPNFTSTTAGSTGTGISVPFGLAYDNTHQRLFVADNSNHRVLVFSGATLSNGMAAAYIIGQSTPTGSVSATTRAGLGSPSGLSVDETGNRLFVGDSGGFGTNGTINYRVMIYDLDSLATGMNAAHVLGQEDFTSADAATTQSGFSGVSGVLYEPTTDYLYVADFGNNRYLIFDAEDITDGEDAISGLGQYDDTASNPGFLFTKNTANNSPSQWGLSGPRDAIVDATHDRLFVADSSNNRVLVYNLNANNTLPNRLPDYVLGQANFHANTAATTAAGLSAPNSIAYDATRNRIFVSDTTNNRILVYSGANLASGMSGSYVLGQSNLTSASAATTQAGLSAPQGIFYDAATDRLFVADTGNHRIKIYNGSALANNMNASNVLGQANFTSASTATTAAGMNTPTDVSYDPENAWIFVADSVNNRVLRFGGTLADGMSASVVLGQADFTHAVTATTATSLRGPTGVHFDSNNDRLFVADYGNNRLVIYPASTMSDGVAAAIVLGQSTFTGSGAATTQVKLSGPRDVTYDVISSQLYVADSTNHRILAFSDAAAVVSNSSSSAEAEVTIQRGGHRGSGRRGPVPLAIPGASSASSRSSTFQSSSRNSLVITVDGEKITFTDLPPSAWFTDYVVTLMNQKIVSGYKDADGKLLGLYRPENPVTYAEIAKMTLLAAKKQIDPDAVPLNRSAQDDWSAGFIAAAEANGVSVYSPALDVRQPATRGAVIQTILEAFGIPVEENLPNSFSDLPVTSQYADALLTAAKYGLIAGDTNVQGQATGTVRPSDSINRAEIAKVLVLAQRMFLP